MTRGEGNAPGGSGKRRRRSDNRVAVCYLAAMTNRMDTDLFGKPVGEAQLELFAEAEGQPAPERYVPKPELVRKSLMSLQRRVLEAGPDTVASRHAAAKVTFFRRLLDEFCDKLALTAPEEVEDHRARITPLIDDLAARLGVDA